MIYIVLPVYNEENNILLLLKEISLLMIDSTPHTDYEIVIVDDGSKDNSKVNINSFISSDAYNDNLKSTISFHYHQKNKGLAEALKTGILYCVEKGKERDIVITMDSDNTHTPGLIFSMLLLIYQGNDIVVASRYKPSSRIIGVPINKKFVSFIGSIIFRVLFPIKNVKDYTSGYRAYKLSLLKKYFKNNSNFISEPGFTCIVDILLKMRLSKENLIINEVPLILRYDKKEGASKMDIGVTTIQMLKLIFKRKFGIKN